MTTRRESFRFTVSEFAETAFAKLSNHSLALDGRLLTSFASAFMIDASISALTSDRKLDNAGGSCVNFCAMSCVMLPVNGGRPPSM